MTTINANEHSAITQTVAAAIDRSISHSEIVRIDPYDARDAICAELHECCEGSTTANDGTIEYWGERMGEDPDEMDEWRVHVAAGDTISCECGIVTGHRCGWTGPESETVTVETMPEYLRASHTAAGNAGTWPHNGAERVVVARDCAEVICDEWTTMID